jgi:Flp pilus assembly protein TadG
MNVTLTSLRKAKGNVLVLTAAALFTLMGIAALAIDLSHAETNKTRMQNLADALALSAAISLYNKESSTTITNRERYAQTYAATITLPCFIGATTSCTPNANAELNGFASTVLNPSTLAGDTTTFTFATVTATTSLTQATWSPAGSATSASAGANFVRVSLPVVNIGTWFAGIMNFQNMGVSATAVAGTSPITPCDLAPFAMCAAVDSNGNVKDPNCQDKTNTTLGNDCYGYVLNALYCMSDESNPSPSILCPTGTALGPGNFGFLNTSGGNNASLQICTAGDPSCNLNCDYLTSMPTKTGQNFGQVSTGFDTRFNEYPGGNQLPSATYPPDMVTGSNLQHLANPELNNGLVDNQGNPLAGFVNYVQTIGSETALSTAYSSYQNAYASGTVTGVTAATIDSAAVANHGIYGRRIFSIPFVNCNTSLNGNSAAPIVGYGCFFMAREYGNVSVPYQYNGNTPANNKYLYGEFINGNCSGIGKSTSTSSNYGFYNVILYKDPIGNNPS